MKQYVVDAFTDKVFCGNPAAVCVLEKELPEELMMNMTRENNLSETAFAVKTGDGRYHLRWFTPGGEIDLCGHATFRYSVYDYELLRHGFNGSALRYTERRIGRTQKRRFIRNGFPGI